MQVQQRYTKTQIRTFFFTGSGHLLSFRPGTVDEVKFVVFNIENAWYGLLQKDTSATLYRLN